MTCFHETKCTGIYKRFYVTLTELRNFTVEVCAQHEEGALEEAYNSDISGQGPDSTDWETSGAELISE
jgi:ribosomal protein L20A (L18A)